MKLWPIAITAALMACGQPYVAGDLYPATTPDCRNWVDGSRFELPRDIDVFAASPKLVAESVVELSIAYFLPKGVEATFANRDYLIAQPRGPAVAQGRVAAIEKVLGSPGARHEVLPELPITLKGPSQGDPTMYVVKIHFSRPIPDRFDLTPPPMLVGGQSYPVRTYTFRHFHERGTYGLCT